MSGKTHVVCGIACVLMLPCRKQGIDIIPVLFSAAVGAELPDIDTHVSSAIRWTWSLIFAFFISIGITEYYRVYSENTLIEYFKKQAEYTQPIKYIWGVVFVILCLAGMYSKHRSFTHSFAALLMYSYLVYQILGDYWVSFFIGYSSHLLLDVLNKKQIRLFYPVKKGLKIGICDSGGFADAFLYAAFLMFIATRIQVLSFL